MSAQGELPLRPMTLGELLDAAMALLRRRAAPLFCAAAVLAALEQVVLAPMRSWAYLSPPYFGPAENHFQLWWLVTSLGFGAEILIITLLGSPAAAAAGPALLGRAVRDRELWRRTRPLATVSTAITLGALGVLGALLGFVPWLLVLGFFGLSAPALVIDRTGNAPGPLGRIGRAVRDARVLDPDRGLSDLVRDPVRAGRRMDPSWRRWSPGPTRSSRGGWRRSRGRWPTPSPTPRWPAWARCCCWTIRVRTEGLDIAISRTRSRGGDGAAPLVHRS